MVMKYAVHQKNFTAYFHPDRETDRSRETGTCSDLFTDNTASTGRPRVISTCISATDRLSQVRAYKHLSLLAQLCPTYKQQLHIQHNSFYKLRQVNLYERCCLEWGGLKEEKYFILGGLLACLITVHIPSPHHDEQILINYLLSSVIFDLSSIIPRYPPPLYSQQLNLGSTGLDN